MTNHASIEKKLSERVNRFAEEQRAIQTAVKENWRKLNQCGLHRFEKIEPWHPIRGRYRCRNCGGEIDYPSFYWFEQGRKMT